MALQDCEHRYGWGAIILKNSTRSAAFLFRIYETGLPVGVLEHRKTTLGLSLWG